jgi:predicted  nucleic acid-binding Zn-ribbon protein
MNWSAILGAIGGVSGIVAVFAFFDIKRAAAVAEGKRMQEAEQAKREIEVLKDRIACLEKDGQDVGKDLVEIKTILGTTLTRLVEDVKELGKKFDEARDRRRSTDVA